MTFYDSLQLIGGTILAIGYLPQIKQLLRTKSCGDLNLKTYIFLIIGIGMMEIYAINLCCHGSGYMFLITNSISLVLVSFISALILKYRERKQPRTITEWDILTQHSYFVSKWADGSVVVTPCEVNIRTKEIVNIVSAPYNIDSILESECVILYNSEYRVFTSKDEPDKLLVDIEDNWVPW